MAPAEWLAADLSDSPPESFLLSEGDKLDWLGSNAFFHRKDSAKSTDSNNNHSNSNTLSGTTSLTPYSLRSNPRSADFESRACSIIGLPKLRRPSKKDRQRNPRVRFFPRLDRSTSVEPRSPKVTCIGRVRSRRGRNGTDHPEEQVGGTRRMRIGWLPRLSSLFLSGCKESQKVDIIARPKPGDLGAVNSKSWMEVKPRQPCLAGTKQIASGRRSASWGNE